MNPGYFTLFRINFAGLVTGFNLVSLLENQTLGVLVTYQSHYSPCLSDLACTLGKFRSTNRIRHQLQKEADVFANHFLKVHIDACLTKAEVNLSIAFLKFTTLYSQTISRTGLFERSIRLPVFNPNNANYSKQSKNKKLTRLNYRIEEMFCDC